MNKDLPPQRDTEGFECDICNALYTSLSAMEAHRRTHPQVESNHDYQCQKCSYSTNRSQDLQDHLHTHSVEKPHRCPHCTKTFARFPHLQRHFLNHTNQRKLACNTIGMTLSHAGLLRRYKRLPPEERRLRCPKCLKVLTRAEYLEARERVRYQQMSYKCTHCSYKTADPCMFHDHLMINHPRDFKPTCYVCGKGLNSLFELSKPTNYHRSVPQISDWFTLL